MHDKLAQLLEKMTSKLKGGKERRTLINTGSSLISILRHSQSGAALTDTASYAKY